MAADLRNFTVRDIAGRRLVRPPTPTRSFATRLTRWHVAVSVAAVAVAVYAAWSSVSHAQHVESLFTPHARSREPHAHHPVLAGMDFSYAFSRIKPVGTPERSWLDWVRALSAEHDDELVRGERGGGELSSFGEEVGDRFLVGPHQGFTRCSTTAYAAVTYFCGAYAASWSPILSEVARGGVAELAASVSRARKMGSSPHSQAVWHVHIDDGSVNRDLGHVFVLRLLPGGDLEMLREFASPGRSKHLRV